jgi:hypothetical protein
MENQHLPNNLYLNIDINADNKPIDAIFDINRSEPILIRPDLYKLNVVRFNINTLDIPINIMFCLDNGITTEITFSAKVGVNEYTRTVLYSSDQGLTAPLKFDSKNPYFFIYSYQ